MLKGSFLFLLAGLFEIGGGYLVWMWLREGKSVWYAIPGFILLACYGVVPVFQSPDHGFGRIYAAYGAVFIILSALWGWAVDGKRLDLLDSIGLGICLVGAMIIMWPRSLPVPPG